MNVTKDRVVRIDCELRVVGGDVIESSSQTGPVEYRHGTGKMLAALEARLEGMNIGEEKSGVIPAAEAFGTDETSPRLAIPRTSFPADTKVEAGARFEAKSPQGTPLSLEVVSVEGETITAKAVHPLAGKDVEFRVKVLSVRPPPPPVPPSVSPKAPESLDDVELQEDVSA